MKYASYCVDGVPCYGIVTEKGVQTVSDQFISRYPDLKSAIACGMLAEASAAATAGSVLDFDTVQFNPVITNPGKILCIGVNYLNHILEMGGEPPEKPVVFIRFPDSVVGHESDIIKPLVSDKYDYEGELAFVIGQTGRHIQSGQAMSYIAGYSCFNDGSVRDFQRHTSQFTAGKNFFHSGAFGPWMVSADEIPDPAELKLETRVNGEVMQQGSVGDLCFDIPALIEYCSSFCQLEPGDVIVTGTMGGVGAAQTPPKWLHPGDNIEIEISKIGTLKNQVAAE